MGNFQLATEHQIIGPIADKTLHYKPCIVDKHKRQVYLQSPVLQQDLYYSGTL